MATKAVSVCSSSRNKSGLLPVCWRYSRETRPRDTGLVVVHIMPSGNDVTSRLHVEFEVGR